MVPLAATVAAVDGLFGWLDVRLGWPPDRTGWTPCAAVDAAFLADWETRIAEQVRRAYGSTHPQTVSGFALGWYGALPGVVGGAGLRQVRRVPRLTRDAVAFRRHPDEEYPDGIALLDCRFWCLPDDPAADHPDATVLPHEAALAGALRAQVRAHADDFLAGYAAGGRLPRRHLLGAFVDGLDTGIWYGGDPGLGAADEVLRLGRLVLPGGGCEFAEPSSVHRLTDSRGRTHLARRRVGCCYYYKVAGDGAICSTCPRLDEATRATRYAELG